MKQIITAILILIASAVIASTPLLQGELNISSFTEQTEGTHYRVVGQFADLSVAGYVGTDVAVSNIIFTETILGTVDAWTITNIVNAGPVNLTVDVVYAESGSSTVGMVASYAGVCSLSTNSVGFPQQPSPEFCHLSDNLLNQIRNYALQRISGLGESAVQRTGDTMTGTLYLPAASTASNAATRYDQVSALLQAAIPMYLTTNLETVATNDFQYPLKVFKSSTVFPATLGTCSVTYLTLNDYPIGMIYTNQGFTSLLAGKAIFSWWCNENTAGSASHKAEVYIWDTVRKVLVEIGEGGPVLPVPSGVSSVFQSAEIPYNAVPETNLFYLAGRMKVMVLSGTSTVNFKTGPGFPCSFSFQLPNRALTEGFYQRAGDQLTGPMDANGNTITGGVFVGDGSGLTNITAGGVTDLSGWSGHNATQQVAWVEAVNVQTNLTVTGALTPNVTGTYVQVGDYAGDRAWSNNGYYVSKKTGAPDCTLGDALGGNGTVAWLGGSYPDFNGVYSEWVNVTGTATVVYSVLTNTVLWRAGWNGTNWNITRDGVEKFSTTNYATLVQEVALQGATNALNTHVQSLIGWTNAVIGATNALNTRMGAVEVSTGSLNTAVGNLNNATNNLNIVANAALPKAGGTMAGNINLGGNTASNGSFEGNGAGITNVTATLPAGVVTNPVGANVNFNGKDATNINNLAVTALQVTGLSGNGVVPVGAVQMYGGAAAPVGWLLCDGAAVGTNQYSALFAVIGTTYGGATTNMNLPDFRGVFPKGAGTTTRAAGTNALGTAYSATLGTYYQDMMQGHRHASITNSVDQLFSSRYAAGTAEGGLWPGGGTGQLKSGNPITDTANGTPRTGASTEPQSLGINFIIKY